MTLEEFYLKNVIVGECLSGRKPLIGEFLIETIKKNDAVVNDLYSAKGGM